MAYKSFKIKEERFYICVSGVFNNVRQYIVGVNTNGWSDVSKWTYQLSDKPPCVLTNANFCFKDSDYARRVMAEWFDCMNIKGLRYERISIQEIQKVTAVSIK